AGALSRGLPGPPGVLYRHDCGGEALRGSALHRGVQPLLRNISACSTSSRDAPALLRTEVRQGGPSANVEECRGGRRCVRANPRATSICLSWLLCCSTHS